MAENGSEKMPQSGILRQEHVIPTRGDGRRGNLSACRGRPAAELVERNKRFFAERVVQRSAFSSGKEKKSERECNFAALSLHER